MFGWIDEIETIHEATTPLMPDDLYRTMTPGRLRDLIVWLQSEGPQERNAVKDFVVGFATLRSRSDRRLTEQAPGVSGS